jgi:hypothetical protein
MSAPTTNAPASAASRWDAYHTASEPPPWESGLPVSQFVDSLSLGIEDAHSMLPSSRGASATSADRGWAIDVGCGSGVSTVHLALSNHFDCCVGVDVSAAAIQKARERALVAGIPVSPLPALPGSSGESAQTSAGSASVLSLLAVDLFDPDAVQPLCGRFRAVFDCQVWFVHTPALINPDDDSSRVLKFCPLSLPAHVIRRITRSEVLMDRGLPRSPRFWPLCLSLAAGFSSSLATQTNPRVQFPALHC